MSGTALADAVLAKLEDLAAQFFVQGVVQPNATSRYVLVDVDGQAPQRCPYLSIYTPRAGDVVWLAGPPGSWVCLGTISGIGTLTLLGLQVNGAINATGSIGSDNNLVAANGLLGAYLRTSGDHTRIGGFISGVTGASQPQLRSPDADASLVAANGQLYVANAANTVARNINAANVSERRLKVEHGVVTGALRKVRALVAGIWSWADPEERADDTTHVGIYVDELVEVEPDATRELPTGEVGYEPNAMIGLLVAAVQELAEQADEIQPMRRRVRGAEERGRALSDRVTGLRTRQENDRRDLRALAERVAALEPPPPDEEAPPPDAPSEPTSAP